jgi:hypothetical protein
MNMANLNLNFEYKVQKIDTHIIRQFSLTQAGTNYVVKSKV